VISRAAHPVRNDKAAKLYFAFNDWYSSGIHSRF
jgi:hypothetical protein